MEVVIHKVIKHIEFETVRAAVVSIAANFSLDPHLINFLLKSLPQYPHYHAVFKEAAHTARVIGKQHYKLNKVELADFMHEYLQDTEKKITQEREDCWKVFCAKLKYSNPYKHILNSEAYKEIEQYVIKSLTP